jgi:hypothetical protein
MDLHLQQHDAFQQREWSVIRAGWVGLTVFVLAGVAGLLGNGPLSWTTATSSGGLVSVEFQRVTHHEADDALTLQFAPDAPEDGLLSVEMTGPWVRSVDLQGMTPEPSEQQLIPGGMVLELPVAQSGVTAVNLSFRAQEYGPLTGTVAVGPDRVSFTQYVLP